MTGTGTANDPYVVSTWAELKALSAAVEENIYIKFADDHETSMIDLSGETDITIDTYRWNIDGNGWSIRNADTSQPLFYPKDAGVTYISDLHFVKIKITNSVFVLDKPVFSGEWQRGLIKWTACTFSVTLNNSAFTYQHTSEYDYHRNIPMMNMCALNAVCEGNSAFETNAEKPIIKNSSIKMADAQNVSATLQMSTLDGDYVTAAIDGFVSEIRADIGTLTGNGSDSIIVVNSNTVPETFIPASSSDIADEAFLNQYDFGIGEEGIELELGPSDFESGSIDNTGEEYSSDYRIRTKEYYRLTGDKSTVRINSMHYREWGVEASIFGFPDETPPSTYNSGWKSTSDTLAAEYNCAGSSADYIRIVIRDGNDPISPSSISFCNVVSDASPWEIINEKLVNKLIPAAPTPPINPVGQDEYISIYDMRTPQNGFSNNGIAILCPTSCKVTEELNGGWNAVLEHPIDENDKWKTIKEGNILKIRGQLFTIIKVEIGYTGNSGKLTTWAEHIFYQLNDPWIPIGTDIVGTTDPAHAATGQTILAAAMNAMVYNEDEYMVIYDYSYASNLNSDHNDRNVAICGLYKWLDTKGMTPIEFIMGSDGFISSLGGELHRDNFYFSIDNRMEEAEEEGFVLKADLNIKSIRRTIDFSTFCTHFTAMTEDGYAWGVSWLASTLIGQYPHNIVREKMFNIDTHGVDGHGLDLKMLYLINEGSRYFRQQCQPLITYTVDVKDLRKHPDYQDLDMFRFKVGDKGWIYDDRFGQPIKLEITKTVTDAITGEVLQVQFGSTRSFTRAAEYDPIQDSDIFVPVPIEQAFPLRDVDGKLLIDSNNKQLFRRVSLNG